MDSEMTTVFLTDNIWPQLTQTVVAEQVVWVQFVRGYLSGERLIVNSGDLAALDAPRHLCPDFGIDPHMVLCVL
jgi:hypothetical protein